MGVKASAHMNLSVRDASKCTHEHMTLRYSAILLEITSQAQAYTSNTHKKPYIINRKLEHHTTHVENPLSPSLSLSLSLHLSLSFSLSLSHPLTHSHRSRVCGGSSLLHPHMVNIRLQQVLLKHQQTCAHKDAQTQRQTRPQSPHT